MNKLGDLLNGLELNKVSLLSANARRFNNLPVTVKGELKDTLKTIVKNRDKGSFDIEVRYAIEGFYKEQTGVVTPIFEIKLTYLIHYLTKLPEAPSAAVLKKVKNKTAILNIWPFIRHQVYILTGEMGVPPLLVKMIASI